MNREEKLIIGILRRYGNAVRYNFRDLEIFDDNDWLDSKLDRIDFDLKKLNEIARRHASLISFDYDFETTNDEYYSIVLTYKPNGNLYVVPNYKSKDQGDFENYLHSVDEVIKITEKEKQTIDNYWKLTRKILSRRTKKNENYRYGTSKRKL